MSSHGQPLSQGRSRGVDPRHLTTSAPMSLQLQRSHTVSAQRLHTHTHTQTHTHTHTHTHAHTHTNTHISSFKHKYTPPLSPYLLSISLGFLATYCSTRSLSRVLRMSVKYSSLPCRAT